MHTIKTDKYQFDVKSLKTKEGEHIDPLQVLWVDVSTLTGEKKSGFFSSMDRLEDYLFKYPYIYGPKLDWSKPAKV